LNELANGKNITIVRGSKRLKFNYKDVIKGKNLQQNILLESGDHIFVP
jgi:polysaccharide export outer membrane protein